MSRRVSAVETKLGYHTIVFSTPAGKRTCIQTNIADPDEYAAHVLDSFPEGTTVHIEHQSWFKRLGWLDILTLGLNSVAIVTFSISAIRGQDINAWIAATWVGIASIYWIQLVGKR